MQLQQAREEADLWGSDDESSGDDGDSGMAPVIDLTGGSDEE